MTPGDKPERTDRAASGAPDAPDRADLAALRAALEAVDHQILDAWARREQLTSLIGETKARSGAPIFDAPQAETVERRARAGARERGLPEYLAVEILQVIMHSSVARQERVRLRARRLGEGRRALVIGGAGRMGSWFVRFLDEQGFAVAVADPALDATAPGEANFSRWSDAPDTFDLTVVAAPLKAAPEVLGGLAESGRRGLIFDIGSVKGPLAPILETMTRRGLAACSVHPMFGPDALTLHRRHVLVMDAGAPAAADAAANLFSGTMAEILRIPLAEHDPLIAFVLGLSHALNLAFLTALRESGQQARRLARLSSVTFDLQMDVAAAVARENPRLYYEIQRLNPFGGRALESLANAVDRLTRIVGEADEPAFIRLMEDGRDYVDYRDKRS